MHGKPFEKALISKVQECLDANFGVVCKIPNYQVF